MAETTVPASALTPRVRDFIAATRFVGIATLDPDGGPRQAVVWYRLDGDEIVLNSADQPTAQADIAEMARRYHADDPAKAERLIANRFTKQQRITFRVRIHGVHEHLDD